MDHYEAVLFDLDGTLVDSTDLILRGFYYTWESFYGYQPSEASIVATIGMVLPEAMVRLAKEGMGTGRILRRPGTDEVAKMVDRYRQFHHAHHDSLIKSYPGVREMIESVRSAGARLGVVTSKRRWSSERALEMFDLRRFIDVVICAEDTEKHKPHPEPVCRATESLGVPPNRTAFTGDSIHDIEAGKGAGVVTVAALWGPTDSESLRRARADYYAESPANVPLLLSEILGERK